MNKIQVNKRSVIAFTKYLLVLVILFFIGMYIYKNVNDLNQYTFNIHWGYIGISFLLILLYQVNLTLIVYFITKLNKCNISLVNTIISCVYSVLGKYVPGKILGYAMLVYFYEKEGKSKITVSFSLFIDLLLTIMAPVLLLVIYLLFIDIPLFEKYRFIAIPLLASFFILAHPSILQWVINKFLILMKREPVQISMTYFQVLQILGLNIINLLIYGFSFLLFINALYPVSFSNYFFITVSATVSSIIGLLALFAPSGIGVREGVLIFALKSIMPPAFAGIISLASRLWMTLAEIFLFTLAFFYARHTGINRKLMTSRITTLKKV